MTLLLSTVLGITGVTGLMVASRNPVLGWTISITVQPLWYAFYISVGAYGLLPLSTGYLIAAILNLRAALLARGCTLAGYPHYAAAAVVAACRTHKDPRR